MMISNFKKWFFNKDAVAAIEMGMLMPMMLVILMGMFDIGSAVLVNQKAINSSQTVSDLLGRHDVITDNLLEEFIKAGELMFLPYDTSSYGIDIAGIQFDGNENNPVERWRETRNMSINATVVNRATGLGQDREGVLGVTVKFTYQPLFSSNIIGTFDIYEVSYVRSRSGLFITRG